MNTLIELEKWLEDNCFSFQDLSIGKHQCLEGIILEECNGVYCYSYSERGHKNIIASFSTEKELVEYALSKLTINKWNQCHLYASTYDESEINRIGLILKHRNINYERNDIPNYKDGKTMFRIFIFGCDIKKVQHL